jgi:hypothetical protein
MYDKGLDIVNKEPILELMNRQFSLNEILVTLEHEGIEFNLLHRFNESMRILEERERDCDVIVSDFIRDNFKYQKIFLTQNHVTNIVLFKVVNYILSVYGFSGVEAPKENMLGHCSRPVTPYEIRAFNFDYQKEPDKDWYEFYKQYVERIFNGQCQKCNDIYSANLLQV